MVPLIYRCAKCSVPCRIAPRNLLLVILAGLDSDEVQILNCKECRNKKEEKD